MRTLTLSIALMCCSCCCGGETAVQERQPSTDCLPDFFRRLDRRASLEFTDTPFEETMQFVNSLVKVGVIWIPEANGTQGAAKITVTIKDTPLAAVLDQLCKQGNTDWTIAPSLGKVCVQIGSPGKIAEIEKKYPQFAEKVREYREKNSEKK